MSGLVFPSRFLSRPDCLDITVSYEGTLLVNERIWLRTALDWPRAAVLIAFVTLMSAGGLMWLRNRKLAAVGHHRRSMIAFAQQYPPARAFVPRLEASPIIEQAALALLLVAFASGVVAAVEFVRAYRARRFYIGETGRCRVPVDATILSRGQWPLLCATAMGFELNLPPGITGAVWLGREQISLSDLHERSLARPYGDVEGSWSLVVPAASRIEFQLGNLKMTVEDPFNVLD